MTEHGTSGDAIRAAIDVYARTPDGFTTLLVIPGQRNYAAKMAKSMNDAGALLKVAVPGSINHYFFTYQGALTYRARVSTELTPNRSKFNGVSPNVNVFAN